MLNALKDVFFVNGGASMIMNIGFDAKRAFFNSTGLGNYSRTLISALVTQYPTSNYHLFSPKKPQKTFSNSLNIPNIHLHLPSNQWFGSYWRTFRLGKKIDALKLEVYHGLSHELPFDIEKAHQTRKIVTIHDVLFMRYPQDFPWIDRQIYHKKFRFACEKADTIISISEQSKQDIIHFLGAKPEKIVVIPPIVATNLKISNVSTYQTPLPQPYILYVGAQTYRKNVISLLKSLPFLPKEIAIVLIGNGYLQKELKQFVAENHYTNRIHFLTNIDDQALAVWYHFAETVVYPSHFEGFGLPIVEALQAGVPVIAGNNSCFSEAGGDGALYVNQAEPTEIAAAVTRILNDSALKAALVQRGRQHIEHFSSENIAKRLMQVYMNE